MKLDRTKIESICDAAQLRLEKRMPIQLTRAEPFELFIAAGESKPPHFRYQRFGIEPTDFPLGCFVVIWWLMKDEDQLVVACPMFFERDHDAFLTDAARKRARINRAAVDAAEFLAARQRAKRATRH